MHKGLLFGCAAVLTIAATASAQITQAEYAARRDSLAARIGNGAVIAFGERTPVTDFGPFFQIPTFHYLTGFDEADAAFILVAHDGHATSTIFLTPIAPRTAFYYGFRPDSSDVPRLYGVQARSFSALTGVADSLATSGVPIYTLLDFEDADFQRQDSLTRGGQFFKAFQLRHPEVKMASAHPLVNQLRARKSPAEIALLRKAAEISSDGHRAVLTMPEPSHEYEIQSSLESTFLRGGGERVAYGSIVGSGERGTQLHYMKDRGPTVRGDLVVIDAATQYQGYAADVTRTVPVSGKFTPEQRKLYQLVRDAQAAAERNAKAGMSPAAAADSSVVIRARGLAELGLIESADATYDCGGANPCQQAQIWMIHGISHGLGLAVHDLLQSRSTYQVGDAFTIEPGIYVSKKMLDVLPDTPRNRAFIAKVGPAVSRYNNTGVRIEDDYVITDQGLERMSNAPREVAEVEGMMAKRPSGKQTVKP